MPGTATYNSQGDPVRGPSGQPLYSGAGWGRLMGATRPRRGGGWDRVSRFATGRSLAKPAASSSRSHPGLSASLAKAYGVDMIPGGLSTLMGGGAGSSSSSSSGGGGGASLAAARGAIEKMFGSALSDIAKREQMAGTAIGLLPAQYTQVFGDAATAMKSDAAAGAKAAAEQGFTATQPVQAYMEPLLQAGKGAEAGFQAGVPVLKLATAADFNRQRADLEMQKGERMADLLAREAEMNFQARESRAAREGQMSDAQKMALENFYNVQAEERANAQEMKRIAADRQATEDEARMVSRDQYRSFGGRDTSFERGQTMQQLSDYGDKGMSDLLRTIQSDKDFKEAVARAKGKDRRPGWFHRPGAKYKYSLQDAINYLVSKNKPRSAAYLAYKFGSPTAPAATE